MTPQPLDDDSGVDAINGAGEDTDFVGGGFMGEGDYAVEEFSIQQRIMHFLGQRIDKQNRFNVEICLLLEAGSSVSDERATTSNLRNDMMMNRYVNLVRTFEVENFVDPAVQEDMALCLFNAKKTMTGLRLWEKFVSWRKEVRTMYMPKLPNNLSTLPKGRHLKDA